MNYFVRVGQGQWHKFFGHPMDSVDVADGHIAGVRVVTFTCNECGRSFDKNICGTCGR